MANNNKSNRDDLFETNDTGESHDLHSYGGLQTTDESTQDKLEPIVVIGIACRFPQDATSPEAFWQMIYDARSGMTDVPRDRFNVDAFYDKANGPGMMNVKGGHFIKDDPAVFDAGFFSISPNEAASMDPQQRWLLENVYDALQNAGIPMERTLGSDTSVYVGSFLHDYEYLTAMDPELRNPYKATGTGSSMLANRLSWFYNLSGPSVVLDTACSSSLVALHLACQSLRSRESSMALVCGCNLMLCPQVTASLTDLHFLSPDSKCYSFDHRANGYSRGEGFGVVVLKPLTEAIKNGDTIRAVIRATGTNQDGRTPGLTQPSSQAQEAMIRRTYQDGGISLATTRFFEAHGTGTALGDPTEAKAVYRAFQEYRSKSKPLYVGAAKSNIGHLEGASGIAGLIKSILVLEKGIIPPNIWFEKPNPLIPSDEWNLAFPLTPTPWPTSGLRRASVSSFGFGGANAHAVLDDAFHYLRLRNLQGRHNTQMLPPTDHFLAQAEIKHCPRLDHSVHTQEYFNKRPKPHLLVWSASDEDGLRRWTLAYQECFKGWLVENEDELLQDLTHTLYKRRSLLPWRSYTIASSFEELSSAIKISPPVRSTGSPAIAFIFTGQGAQWRNMGRELLEYPVYRDSLVAAENYFSELGCQWSLLGEMYNESDSNLGDPMYSQPMCTALQVALVDLLSHWGLLPAAVIGHSSGEIAAAYCAGGLSRTSAWKVAYYRGLAAASINNTDCEATSMMSVALSERDVRPYLEPGVIGSAGEQVFVGCVNSPTNVTLSGSRPSLEKLSDLFKDRGIFCRSLKVNVAYHTKYMERISFVYRSLIQNLQQGDVERRPVMFSSVTGHRIGAASLTEPDYWVRNMVSRVRFTDAASWLCARPSNQMGLRRKIQDASMVTDFVLELGPHSTLQGPLKDIFTNSERGGKIGYSSFLRRNESATLTALEATGKLHCFGFQLNLDQVNTRNPDHRSPQMLTSLPNYPFNHSKRYWLEGRQSKSYRFRPFPQHNLLGTSDADWNPLLAKWHNTVSSSSQAFVKDHKVNGVETYPAAGMLVMVIEAMKQLHTDGEPFKYHLKDVIFHKALAIPSTSEGIDVQLLVGPSGVIDKANPWTEFRLYAYDGKQWDEVCQGAVSTELAEEKIPGTVDNINHTHECQRETQAHMTIFEDGRSRCLMSMATKRLYETFMQQGLHYGPSFQNLRKVYFDDDGHAAGAVSLQSLASHINQDDSQSYVIHPTTLDSIFQLAFPALTQGGKRLIPTMVPTRMNTFWISDSVRNLVSDEEIRLFAQGTLLGFRNAKILIIAVERNHKPCLVVDFEMTFVAGDDTVTSNRPDRLQRFYNLHWKPDLELLNNHQVESFSTSSCDATPFDQILANEKEAACLLVMQDLLQRIKTEDLAEPAYIRNYYEWMLHRCRDFPDVKSIFRTIQSSWNLEDGHSLEQLLHQLDNHDVEGKMIVRVARNLEQVLTGNLDALELLFSDDLIQEYYRKAHDAPYTFGRVRTYIDAMSHKNPGMKILELGAGTGGATSSIVDTPERHPRYSEYAFTDISPSFFAKAQEQFQDDRMLFKILDIEKDPTEQGFEAESYDIVIAANVLHATSDIDQTLQNAKKLIRQGGKLVLFEGLNPERIRISFIFGLLAGWWLSTEEHRRWGPMMSQERWHDHLVRAGFTGIDVLFSTNEDPQHQLCSGLVTTVPLSIQEQVNPRNMIIIREDSSPVQNAVSRQLEHSFESHHHTRCRSVTLAQLRELKPEQTYCIFLLELERPLLDDLDVDSLETLKHLCATAPGLLWLTHTDPKVREDPRSGAMVGLSRCLAQEYEGLRSVTLDIQTLSPDDVTANIVKVLEATLFNPSANWESEYAEFDGRLCIGRVVSADDITSYVLERTKPKPLENRSINQVGPSLELTIGVVGLLDSLHFREEAQESRPLPNNEIEILTKAVGMNFRDVLVALGQLPSSRFGNECAGIVTRVGPSAKSRFNVGDRVVSARSAAFRTRNRCVATVAKLIPDHMDFATAAAIPIAFCTAEYCLSHWAHLRAGESILIHSAAGGFGQAVVQLAKLRRAEIFITVGTDEKRSLMTELYGIPEDHIFSSRNLQFAKGVRRMTQNRGVDVIINSLAGEGLRSSWECIAPFGRFIEVGKKDIYTGTNSNLGGLPMAPFSKNVMFASVDLALIMDTDPHTMAGLMERVMSLAKVNEAFAPQPLRKYKASEIQTAFRYMQSGKQSGKLIVEFDHDDMITVAPSSRPTYEFDSQATYVLAGGLGGIGRSLSRWMVGRKARNLILLSRSTTYNEETAIFLQELKDRGVNVATPPCDVGDASRLEEVLRSCATTMPPIKGCIQGSMVLENAMFKNMNLEKFEKVLKPKVQGSWNLHHLLPKGMDFFIMLSSYAGIIGSIGQSNYACGNTYQDALARHRVAHGEKAVALDLGVIESVGIVSEHADVAGFLQQTGHEGLGETELHALLEYHCDPELPIQTSVGSQVITSLELPSVLHAKNLIEQQWASRPMFRQLWQIRSPATSTQLGATGDVTNPTVVLHQRLTSGASLEEASNIICDLIRTKVSRMLAIDEESIDMGKPMHTYGVDSLTAIELRNWFAKAIGSDVAVFSILGNESMASLAELAAKKSIHVKKGSEKTDEAEEEIDEGLDGI